MVERLAWRSIRCSATLAASEQHLVTLSLLLLPLLCSTNPNLASHNLCLPPPAALPIPSIYQIIQAITYPYMESGTQEVQACY